jgi:hypothetical protein
VQLGLELAPTLQPTEETVVCNVCGFFSNTKEGYHDTCKIREHVNSPMHTEAKAAADQNVNWQAVPPRGKIDWKALVRWFLRMSPPSLPPP